jgi:hypothetical protein
MITKLIYKTWLIEDWEKWPEQENRDVENGGEGHHQHLALMNLISIKVLNKQVH